MFLSRQEIQDATMERAFCDQILWLRMHKIPFDLDRLGRPVVARSQVDAMRLVVDVRLPAQTLQRKKTMATTADILNERIQAPIISGIYFLISGNEIIYVGQSRNILYRVGYHSRSIAFDAYSVLPCPPGNLTDLERKMIKKFNPRLNINNRDYPRDIGIVGYLQNIAITV